MKIEEIIVKELNVVKQLLDLHRQITPENRPKILGQMIALMVDAPSYERTPFEWTVEWMIDQAYNNTLPNTSSGSWYSALSDIDNIASGILDGEDSDDYEEQYELLTKKYDEIVLGVTTE